MIVNILKSYARVCNAKSVVPLPPSLALPERSSATEAAEMADNPKRNVKSGTGTRAGAAGKGAAAWGRRSPQRRLFPLIKSQKHVVRLQQKCKTHGSGGKVEGRERKHG